MSFALILQILWPISVIAIPFVVGAGVLWLKSQFPTRAELTALDAKTADNIKELNTTISAALKELDAKADDDAADVRARFENGSRKFSEYDRRLALVEDDCKASPTKNDLNQGMTVLAGRMSGMESGLKGVERQLATQHDYLRTLIERGSAQ